MKERLIILSDLWGIEKSDWVDFYMDNLSPAYDLHYYDCCDLADLDKSNYTEESLHQQFVNGGIDRAVNSLLELEKEKINILAFSVGGVIAWKYGLISHNIDSLYCVSSTRLRYESKKPPGILNLYFGDNDEYRPDQKWFRTLELLKNIIVNKGHYLYRDNIFASSVVKKLLSRKTNKKVS